ncbi:hypothetical protein CWO85_01755 [Candidatus Phytoplasma ziziphi]|uniref:Uncharacterized protein n=1 Tax=Ziziphus jujuba witches'-broom phytoplasma TaxID=135727 RepID=A0A660HMJ1_ZIZJU|nr:hypothetical protein [Candidatus Phytoplasma ziziphi]AYJ01248.1 hypothetical protein CWO85_01755 [Candidatus Phytoplasma ziziphi]
MKNIKKKITNYKKTFIFLTIILFCLISLSIYCLTNKKEIKIIENKHITWNQTPSNEEEYNESLQRWKNQCIFKQGNEYTGDEVRNKLGKSWKTLYCLDGGNIIKGNLKEGHLKVEYKVSSLKENNYNLDYCYFYNLYNDVMNFKRPMVSSDNSIFFKDPSPIRLIFTYGSLIKFDTYCDTTPPPTKPSHMR